eukprot:s2_g70.t1
MLLGAEVLKECLGKYNHSLLAAFQRMFKLLPLFAVIEKEIFVVHGGLFRNHSVNLEMLRELPKVHWQRNYPNPLNKEEMEQGKAWTEEEEILFDALWADPHHGIGSKRSERGRVAVMFGEDVTERFLDDAKLSFGSTGHLNSSSHILHDRLCERGRLAPSTSVRNIFLAFASLLAQSAMCLKFSGWVHWRLQLVSASRPIFAQQLLQLWEFGIFAIQASTTQRMNEATKRQNRPRRFDINLLRIWRAFSTLTSVALHDLSLWRYSDCCKLFLAVHRLGLRVFQSSGGLKSSISGGTPTQLPTHRLTNSCLEKE